MGASMCNTELDSENYPPVRRYLKTPGNKTETRRSMSPTRASVISNKVHVMSYNVLADCLATPEMHPF